MDQIKAHIDRFLKNIKQPIVSETHLQVMLAVYLTQTGYYDDVFAEYTIPKSYLGEEYKWGKEKDKVSVDLVVRRDDEYFPIELKYKTKEENTGLKLFGCEKKDIILAQQNALNEACYGFWKDVKRLELIRKNFAKVSGGFALFVTNDDNYIKGPAPGTQYEPFSIRDGKKVVNSKAINWDQSNAKISADRAKKFPPVNLSNDYQLKWEKFGSDKHKLYYLLLMVGRNQFRTTIVKGFSR